MEKNIIEPNIKGKATKGSSISINNKLLVATGKLIKTVSVKDEEWIEGQVINDPESFIAALKKSKLKADIFTFSQKLPHTKPMYRYYMEWDNLAVIPITSFAEWWTKLPQATRKNVRRAEKKGVVVKVMDFDDELVKGIVKIYNESPLRQGRLFWHYGKAFDNVKMENSTYLDKSDFICAYHGNELIGFIKLVFVGKEAKIMQIISMIKHQDKRPANALIAKAVEICDKKGMEFFIYCQYVYGKNIRSPIIEFKDRNGFEKIDIPKYYIPLTKKGKLILNLKLHHRIVDMIPGKVYNTLLKIRSKWYFKWHQTS
jgi:hypothetical protein